jgi:hypothetical protein
MIKTLIAAPYALLSRFSFQTHEGLLLFHIGSLGMVYWSIQHTEFPRQAKQEHGSYLLYWNKCYHHVIAR